MSGKRRVGRVTTWGDERGQYLLCPSRGLVLDGSRNREPTMGGIKADQEVTDGTEQDSVVLRQ